KALDRNDVVALALADALLAPGEGVLALPHQRPDGEVVEAELLAQFAAQPGVDGLAGLEPAARRDPEVLSSAWRMDAHQQHLVRRGQQDGADRVALDDHVGSSSCSRRGRRSAYHGVPLVVARRDAVLSEDHGHRTSPMKLICYLQDRPPLDIR